jgi:hypothetical protein
MSSFDFAALLCLHHDTQARHLDESYNPEVNLYGFGYSISIDGISLHWIKIILKTKNQRVEDTEIAAKSARLSVAW